MDPIKCSECGTWWRGEEHRCEPAAVWPTLPCPLPHYPSVPYDWHPKPYWPQPYITWTSTDTKSSLGPADPSLFCIN